METNKLIAGIVTTAIAVIVLAGVLMPALDNATTVNDTFKNTGHFNMEKIASTDATSYTVSWDATTPNQLTVNDETVSVDTGSASQLSLICGDDWLFRANISSGNIASISYIVTSGGSTVSSSSLTCTLTGGSMSAVIDATNKTGSYTSAYIPYKDGSYMMKKTADSAYINGNSELFGMGMSYINTDDGNKERGIKLSGTYDDLTISVWRPPSDVSSFSNITTDTAAISSHEDLYTIKQIKFVCTYTNSDTTTTDTDLTYSYFVVPAEVTAERAVHLEPAMNTILSVIPMIIIVAVLLGVVAIFMIRRE